MRTMTVVTLLALVVTVAVAQPVTITGRVVGPDGEAVAGTAVAMRVQSPTALEWVEAVSDANGRFTLQFDPERERPLYQIIAVAEGLSYGAARVEPGAEVEIVLPRVGEPITGTVVADDGAPVAGAFVTAPQWSVGEEGINAREWRVPSALSDERGHFSLSGLPPGARAALRVKAEGYADYWISTLEDRVATGAEVAIVLHPEALVAGHVTRDGEPVADVRVGAQSTDASTGDGWGEAVTDRGGGYVIRGLPAGTYDVALHEPEGLTAVAHEGVTVEAGQRVEGRDFALIEGSLVHGAVTWADTGEPVADALIAAYGPARPKSGAWVQNARTDAVGQYELRLPPGENYVYWMGGPDDAWQSEPESETFELGDEPHTVDFALTRTPGIVLTVRLPDGAPAVSMPVLWGGVGSYPLSSPEPLLTDERGQVALTFRRRILWEGDRAYAAAVVSDEERELAGAALIDAEVQREATIWLARGAYVSGSVDTQEGEPVPEVSVRVTAEPEGWDTQLPISAATDKRGEFRLGPLPPGLPLMLGPDWGYREQVIEPDVQAFRDEITLEPGETRHLEPWIIAPEGLTLRGRVVDAAGHPAAGAIAAYSNPHRDAPATATTDAEGRFELTGISPAGECLVVAYSPDLQTAYAQPCDPRIAYEPTFALMPVGNVTVIVVDDGQPIAEAHARVYGGRHTNLPQGLTLGTQMTPVDAEGKLRVTGLVPGVQYDVMAFVGPEDDPVLVGYQQPDLLADQGDVEITIELMTRVEAEAQFR